MGKYGLSIIALLALLANQAHGDWIFLPASRHPLFLTYGLFNEEQTSLLFKDENRVYLDLGDGWTLLEQSDWWGKPQLAFSASVDSSFGTKGHAFQYGAQSMDVRSQVLIELTPAREWRLYFGDQHTSGHVLEGVPERELVGPDLGDDGLLVRFLRDFENHVRLGGTLRYYYKRTPDGKAVAADQFAEWFPWGADSPGARANHSPYVAIGIEENGYDSYQANFHLQLGLLYGYHFEPERTTTLRLALGFYHGADPRLKYFAFLQSTSDFIYLGSIVNF